MKAASFEVLKISDTKIVIRDLDGVISITNDAENVTEKLFKTFGDKRFYYYDTVDEIAELLHDKGRFIGFHIPSQ